MKGEPNLYARALNTQDDSGGTQAIVTLAAVDGITHVIDWIGWSYSVNAAVEDLTVTINSVEKYKIDIPISATGSDGFFPFPGGLHGSPGQSVVITLSASFGDDLELNVGYR